MPIFVLAIYSQQISQTLIASSLKLSQLIEENEEINWSKFKQKYFFSYCPLQIWSLKT